LHHWAACAERSSKQKGKGEGKEGKEEGSISEFRKSYFGLKGQLRRDEAEMW